METKTYIGNFWQLYDACWSGALDTLNTIIDCDLQDEFFDWICGYFTNCGEIPEQTEVNDLIWFERDFIAQEMGFDSFEEMMIKAKEE